MTIVPAAQQKCEVCKGDFPDGAKICSGCKLPRGPIQCAVCKKWIPSGARYCNECNSYQNCFLRYIPSLLVPLSVFTTLIAIIMPTITAWNWVRYHESHTSATLISASQQKISLYVWNTGRNPSIVLSCRLRYAGTDSDDARLELKTPNSIIRPSGQTILDLFPPQPDKKPAENGSVIIQVQESDGSRPEIPVTLSPGFMNQLLIRYKVVHPGDS